MKQTIEQQLATLRHLTPAQLREKYLKVFGEPTHTGNKVFLLKRIAWRMQSLAEGGLSERARMRASELARDADIRTTIPRVREASSGADTVRLVAPTSYGGSVPIPGSVLTRKYRDKVIEVTVLPNGFDYQGQMYRSLSAIAKVVTGSHWNGHAFFGLREKKTA